MNIEQLGLRPLRLQVTQSEALPVPFGDDGAYAPFAWGFTDKPFMPGVLGALRPKRS